MIKIKKLYLSFTDKYYSLYDINLNVKNKSKICLMGDKDSGNDLLVRCIANLEFYKGEVFINGNKINKNNNREYLEGYGYVSSKGIFLDKLSVYENLEYIYKIRKLKINHERIKKTIRKFGIEHIKDKKVNELNSYEKMTLSISRLSLRQINIFFIENIFKHFINEQQKQLIRLIKNMIGENDTVIVSLDDYSIAKELNLDIVRMENGSIV